MKQQEIILDSGQALKYYIETEDTEVIFSQTYYLNIDAKYIDTDIRKCDNW